MCSEWVGGLGIYSGFGVAVWYRDWKCAADVLGGMYDAWRHMIWNLCILYTNSKSYPLLHALGTCMSNSIHLLGEWNWTCRHEPILILKQENICLNVNNTRIDAVME